MAGTTPPERRFSAIFVRAFAYRLIPVLLGAWLGIALFSPEHYVRLGIATFVGGAIGVLAGSLSQASNTIRVTPVAVVFPPRPFRKARELPLASLDPASIRLKGGRFGRYIILAPSGEAFSFVPFIYGPAQTAALLALLRREAVV